jgi:hypothetical protein
MSALSIEDVKQLPLDKVYMYALKHLANLDRKKKWNRRYNTNPQVKERQRQYYYTKHDIYHPDCNPDGTVEKRYKRVTS